MSRYLPAYPCSRLGMLIRHQQIKQKDGEYRDVVAWLVRQRCAGCTSALGPKGGKNVVTFVVPLADRIANKRFVSLQISERSCGILDFSRLALRAAGTTVLCGTSEGLANTPLNLFQKACKTIPYLRLDGVELVVIIPVGFQKPALACAFAGARQRF